MQQKPTQIEAVNVLTVVRAALAREKAGVHVLVWNDTPLGPLWGEALGGKLTTLKWGTPEGYVVQSLDASHQSLWNLLDTYFQGNLAQPPWHQFAPKGTPFQTKVWQALCDIPWGETWTYGQLAEKVGSHARAVGGAVGSNPVPILIPCHRIMGANGAMTCFSAPGGIATKEWLLRHEGVLL